MTFRLPTWLGGKPEPEYTPTYQEPTQAEGELMTTQDGCGSYQFRDGRTQFIEASDGPYDGGEAGLPSIPTPKAPRLTGYRLTCEVRLMLWEDEEEMYFVAESEIDRNGDKDKQIVWYEDGETYFWTINEDTGKSELWNFPHTSIKYYILGETEVDEVYEQLEPTPVV